MRRAGNVRRAPAVSSSSRRRLVCVVLPLFALLLVGCTARLTLPGAPTQPRAVVLLEHDNHSSLILTDAGAVPWRFAYGDWRWYVDGEHGPIAVARALLVPSRAALGRRALRPYDPRLGWQPQVGSTITGEIAFAAESARVDALLSRLQAIFASAVPPPTDASHLKLEVVTDPVPYTLCHNSNHRVATWLRETGVEVRGNPAFGRWRVVP